MVRPADPMLLGVEDPRRILRVEQRIAAKNAEYEIKNESPKCLDELGDFVFGGFDFEFGRQVSFDVFLDESV